MCRGGSGEILFGNTGIDRIEACISIRSRMVREIVQTSIFDNKCRCLNRRWFILRRFTCVCVCGLIIRA